MIKENKRRKCYFEKFFHDEYKRETFISKKSQKQCREQLIRGEIHSFSINSSLLNTFYTSLDIFKEYKATSN